MPVSMESVICPYCKRKTSGSIIYGRSGLINCSGYQKDMNCDYCGKEFQCTVDVKVKYKTKKRD